MINAYLYSSCTSCRKTETVLKESGTAFTRRDFFKDRFSKEELSGILNEAGLSASDILSRRSKVYLARQDEIDGRSEDALLDLIIQEPTLLRRPMVIGHGEVVVGHNEGKLSELISRNVS